MSSSFSNSVRARRQARGWSQQELADRAALSRAGVSAIEAGRLAPAVTAALALARALECSVEDLFGVAQAPAAPADWAFPPDAPRRRYWNARVGTRLLTYPVEADSPHTAWHDGVSLVGTLSEAAPEIAEQTLVVATCDPAAELLALEYSRQFRFRMIVLRRSSRQALALLAAGLAHAAGVHLSHAQGRSANAKIARSVVGQDCRLLHVARWEEGLVVSPHLHAKTIDGVLRARARWIGREEGSGARECQDQVLGNRPAPKRIAADHRMVAAAVKCGWADTGPCVRLASEEAGLSFLGVRHEDYDLCYSAAGEHDPRVVALVATLRSRGYRLRLGELPGYTAKHTGEER